MGCFELYLDESGTNFDSPYIYVVGCMMEREEWLSLTDGWASVLREFDIRRFRASDCEAVQGDFRGWSRDKRNDIFMRFAKEVNKRDYVISRVGIEKQLFNSVSAKFPKVSVSLYEFGVMWSVKIGGLLPNIYNREGTIELFFERGQVVRFHVRNYINGISKRQDYPISNISFPSKNYFVPYQVADLIAWEYHKYTTNYLKDSDSAIRPSLKVFGQYPNRHISKDYGSHSKEDLELEFQLLNDRSPSGFLPP